jgi:hypothetical protein
MIQGQAVWIISGSGNAALYIFLPQTRERSNAQLYCVYGDGTSDYTKKKLIGKSKSNFKETMLPGIDVPEIIRCLYTGGGAKHSTFGFTGNRFSRIASLVHRGYSATVGQAFVAPKSGVRITWNQNDLISYADTWKASLAGKLAQTNAACEEQRRFVGLHEYAETCFVYESDTEVRSFKRPTKEDIAADHYENNVGKTMVNF